jgi:uncharacterized protein YidB (DUF937 family)
MTRAYGWREPAKLYFWPADDGSEEEALYPTLLDAIRAAGEGEADKAWIVTEAGHILNPRIIAALQEETLAQRRQKRVALNPFTWARAA